ncbi:MAG: P63C domain-containing protein [Verrucomicrobia bacterium]|nr:P63C domain-containing protein [Verrucomicrobiota bacterium]
MLATTFASMEQETTPKGKAGGDARARKLTADERKAIAMRGSQARWTKDLPKAICGSMEQPLIIGNASIPCYVLEDETRVLVQTAMIESLGMARGTAGGKGGDRLASFVSQDRLKPFINNELKSVIENPIKFVVKGAVAYGYSAETLADICFAVDEAARAGVLQKQQAHIALEARVLIRAFAKTGITALVDEATGYQQIRAKDALARILEKFIAKELQPWTRTFPIEFYQEIFRLNGWAFDPLSVKRPGVIGHWTNDIVYNRLAPGVLPELRSKNPSVDGRRKSKHFQWLTGEVGHPKLMAHLEGVKIVMRESANWAEFTTKLNKYYPLMETTELGLEVQIAKKPKAS